MSGTKEGGRKAAATNIRLHGSNFYKVQGAIGGKKGTTGGFWHAKYVLNDTKKIAEAGRLGGQISRKG